MALELTRFEVVLHICILLNFLYAVSDDFSQKVFPLLKAPFKNKFEAKMEKASLYITTLESINSNEKIEILRSPFTKLSQRVNDFNSGSDRDYHLGPKFKSLYLLAGLYSFLILILSGFHEYLDPDKLCCTIFYSNVMVSVFSILVIIFTFTNKALVVKGAWSLMAFVVIFLFQFINYNSNPRYHIHCLFQSPKNYTCVKNDSLMTIFSLIVVLSPFILHIMRATFELFRNFWGINRSLQAFEVALITIFKGNPPDPTNYAAAKNTIVNTYRQFVSDSNIEGPGKGTDDHGE